MNISVIIPSLNPDENENVITRFLEGNQNFESVRVLPDLKRRGDDTDWISLMPHILPHCAALNTSASIKIDVIQKPGRRISFRALKGSSGMTPRQNASAAALTRFPRRSAAVLRASSRISSFSCTA